MALTSEHLTEGEIYSRAMLAKFFHLPPQGAINTGVFIPDKSRFESVWLFVTEEKDASMTQFQDRLAGDTLYWQGQTEQGTDRLISTHKHRGLELLLFYRKNKREHPNSAFVYEGVFEYQSHDPDSKPTNFVLRRRGCSRQSIPEYVGLNTGPLQRAIYQSDLDSLCVLASILWFFKRFPGAGAHFAPVSLLAAKSATALLLMSPTDGEPAHAVACVMAAEARHLFLTLGWDSKETGDILFQSFEQHYRLNKCTAFEVAVSKFLECFVVDKESISGPSAHEIFSLAASLFDNADVPFLLTSSKCFLQVHPKWINYLEEHGESISRLVQEQMRSLGIEQPELTNAFTCKPWNLNPLFEPKLTVSSNHQVNPVQVAGLAAAVTEAERSEIQSAGDPEYALSEPPSEPNQPIAFVPMSSSDACEANHAFTPPNERAVITTATTSTDTLELTGERHAASSVDLRILPRLFSNIKVSYRLLLFIALIRMACGCEFPKDRWISFNALASELLVVAAIVLSELQSEVILTDERCAEELVAAGVDIKKLWSGWNLDWERYVSPRIARFTRERGSKTIRVAIHNLISPFFLHTLGLTESGEALIAKIAELSRWTDTYKPFYEIDSSTESVRFYTPWLEYLNNNGYELASWAAGKLETLLEQRTGKPSRVRVEILLLGRTPRTVPDENDDSAYDVEESDPLLQEDPCEPTMQNVGIRAELHVPGEVNQAVTKAASEIPMSVRDAGAKEEPLRTPSGHESLTLSGSASIIVREQHTRQRNEDDFFPRPDSSKPIDVSILARLFENTSGPHKYLLFLSILELIRSDQLTLGFEAIASRMLSIAAKLITINPRLSVGESLDRTLSEAGFNAQKFRSNWTEDKESLLAESLNRVLPKIMPDLFRYVPHLLIRPFFEHELGEKMTPQELRREIVRLSEVYFAQVKPIYLLNDVAARFEFHPYWTRYLIDNRALLRWWTNQQFAHYLKRINQHIDDIDFGDTERFPPGTITQVGDKELATSESHGNSVPVSTESVRAALDLHCKLPEVHQPVDVAEATALVPNSDAQLTILPERLLDAVERRSNEDEPPELVADSDRNTKDGDPVSAGLIDSTAEPDVHSVIESGQPDSSSARERTRDSQSATGNFLPLAALSPIVSAPMVAERAEVPNSSPVQGVPGSDGGYSPSASVGQPKVRPLLEGVWTTQPPSDSNAVYKGFVDSNVFDGVSSRAGRTSIYVAFNTIVNRFSRTSEEPRSFAELNITAAEFAWLKDWIGNLDATTVDAFLVRNATSKPSELNRYTQREAIGTLLLLTCSELNRREGCEGSIWQLFMQCFDRSLDRSTRYLHYNTASLSLCESFEESANALGLRNVFGSGDTMKYLITVFLQFGFTKNGIRNIPIWLARGNYTESVRQLMSEHSPNHSPTFTRLWKAFDSFMRNRINEDDLRRVMSSNTWVLSEWHDEIVQSIRNPYARTSVTTLEKSNVAVGDSGNFIAAYFEWSPGVSRPKFELRLDLTRLFLLPEQVVSLRLNNKEQQLFKDTSGQWDSRQPITMDVSSCSCLAEIVGEGGEPIATQELQLWDPSEDVQVFDMSTKRLVSSDLPLRSDRTYAILASDDLVSSIEPTHFITFTNIERKLYLLDEHSIDMKLLLDDCLLWPVSQAVLSGGQVPSVVAMIDAYVDPRHPTIGQPFRILFRGESEFAKVASLRVNDVPIPLKSNGFTHTGDIKPGSLGIDGTIKLVYKVRHNGRLYPVRRNLDKLFTTGSARWIGSGWELLDPSKPLTADDCRRDLFTFFHPSFAKTELRDWGIFEGSTLCQSMSGSKMKLSGAAGYGAPLEIRKKFNSDGSCRSIRVADCVVDPGCIKSTASISESGQTKLLIELDGSVEVTPNFEIVIWNDSTPPRFCQPEQGGDSSLLILSEDLESEHVAVALALNGCRLGAAWPKSDSFITQALRTMNPAEIAAYLRWFHWPILSDRGRASITQFARDFAGDCLAAWTSSEGLDQRLLHEPNTSPWNNSVRQIFDEWWPDVSDLEHLTLRMANVPDDIKLKFSHVIDAAYQMSVIDPLLMGRFWLTWLNAPQHLKIVLPSNAYQHLATRILKCDDKSVFEARKEQERVLELELSRSLIIDPWFLRKQTVEIVDCVLGGDQLEERQLNHLDTFRSSFRGINYVMMIALAHLSKAS